MDPSEKYDMLSSKLVGDMTTYDELKEGKRGSELSIFEEARLEESMWIEFETREVEAVEGIYKCKCGSTKVYTAKEQRRGGDEGMTFFVKCVRQECGRIWTI